MIGIRAEPFIRRITLTFLAVLMLVAGGGFLNISVDSASGSAMRSTVNATSWSSNVMGPIDLSTNTEAPAVACGTAILCAAVGSQGPTASSQTFADMWNGGEWSVTSIPNAPGATSAGLEGVSCVGSGFCMAVGNATFAPGQQTLTEEWNGTAWSILPSPNPPGTEIVLSGVSCSSTSLCTAVGAGGSDNTELIETWDGTSWSIATGAVPPGATSVQLRSIRCIGTTWCMAVGHASVAGAEMTLAELWNGSAWSVVPSPNVGAGSTWSELDDVACAGPGFCQAVGLSIDTSANSHNLIESWNGQTWTIASAPDNGAVAHNLLSGVSCISPTACTAVGSAGMTTTSYGTTVLNWDGNSWTLDPSPPANEPGEPSTSLRSISCLADALCQTTGYFETGSGVFQPYGSYSFIDRSGYRFVASDGGVFDYGAGAPFLGSMGGTALNAPVVAMAVMPSGDGYYLAASDGGVFAFGSARFYGSMGGHPLNRPIVGMAVTSDGGGYWLVASDGGIFSFGDAQFYGSMGATPLNQPVVAMASSPDGLGYYLVAADGGIFNFGDAPFYGSTGSIHLNKPVVGMTVPSSGGYYLVASDGGVFNFPTPFDPTHDFCPGSPIGVPSCNYLAGSAANLPLNAPVVGMAQGQGGYYLVASDGGVFAYGAPFLGSTGGIRLNAPIVGMAT